MLASTTSTVIPQQVKRMRHIHSPTPARLDTVQHFIQGRPRRLVDEEREEVFLQGMMRVCGAGAQDRMRLRRHILDLHVRHGAISAPCSCMRNA